MMCLSMSYHFVISQTEVGGVWHLVQVGVWELNIADWTLLQ